MAGRPETMSEAGPSTPSTSGLASPLQSYLDSDQLVAVPQFVDQLDASPKCYKCGNIAPPLGSCCISCGQQWTGHNELRETTYDQAVQYTIDNVNGRANPNDPARKRAKIEDASVRVPIHPHASSNVSLARSSPTSFGAQEEWSGGVQWCKCGFEGVSALDACELQASGGWKHCKGKWACGGILQHCTCPRLLTEGVSLLGRKVIKKDDIHDQLKEVLRVHEESRRLYHNECGRPLPYVGAADDLRLLQTTSRRLIDWHFGTKERGGNQTGHLFWQCGRCLEKVVPVGDGCDGELPGAGDVTRDPDVCQDAHATLLGKVLPSVHCTHGNGKVEDGYCRWCTFSRGGCCSTSSHDCAGEDGWGWQFQQDLLQFIATWRQQLPGSTRTNQEAKHAVLKKVEDQILTYGLDTKKVLRSLENCEDPLYAAFDELESVLPQQVERLVSSANAVMLQEHLGPLLSPRATSAAALRVLVATCSLGLARVADEGSTILRLLGEAACTLRVNMLAGDLPELLREDSAGPTTDFIFSGHADARLAGQLTLAFAHMEGTQHLPEAVDPDTLVRMIEPHARNLRSALLNGCSSRELGQKVG